MGEGREREREEMVEHERAKRGKRERDSLLGARREKNSGVASLSSGRRPRKIHTGARGAESGRAVRRGGATPFFGVHGGENDNWSSWQRPSRLVSILPEYSSTTPAPSDRTLCYPFL